MVSKAQVATQVQSQWERKFEWQKIIEREKSNREKSETKSKTHDVLEFKTKGIFRVHLRQTVSAGR